MGAEHPVCWLRGPAGTGKSTIAHTIAVEIDSEQRMAATFFYSRGKGNREEIRKVVPTLAYQIAQKVRSMEPHIRRALEDNILSSTLGNQLS
jgi:ABC-type molybdenum transport system ATPase subunit/photorepair protein PhrA